MSDNYKPIIVKRILVALDHSTHSLSALEAAIELTRHFYAELKGIYIEDVTLLNLAQMDFCQEVGQHTAIIRKMTTDGVSRGINVQSRWVVQSFRRLTKQNGIDAGFIVVRGDVHETIQEESQGCDLIVIGKTGTNPIPGHRLGSTAQALIRNHRIPLMLVEENTRLGFPMLLLYQNSPIGKICLETARSLLSPEETLIILLCEDNQDAFRLKRDAVKQWAATHNVNLTIEGYKTPTANRMIAKIKALDTGLLILPQDDNSPINIFVHRLLEEVTLPILLIRDCE